MVGKFNKKTIQDISLKGKRVLLRADYNVPVSPGGGIADDFRLTQSLPTLKYILEQAPSALIIISHLGRPQSPHDKQFSLAPVARKLEHLLGKKVHFANDCIGPVAAEAASNLPAGAILMLENLRFHGGEEQDDKQFAKEIVDATGAEVFVQDGFGVVHRAHASTDAITELLPSVAGLLLEKEVSVIEQAMRDPGRPLTAVIGGAKIADKIDVLNRMIELADCVAVGGALANDFLRAEGYKLGKSLIDATAFDLAEDVLQRARRAEKNRQFKFILPVDAVVSTDAAGKKTTRLVDLKNSAVADIESYPKRPAHSASNILADERILDIGPVSAALISGAIGMSRTVVWGGTMGMAEVPGIAGAEAPFGHGTKTVVEAIIGSSNAHASKPFSIVGGGDTVSYVESQGLTKDFSHVSTGGSASLELIAGHKLPGLAALEDK